MAGQPPRPAWMRYPARVASVSLPDPVDPPPLAPVQTRPPLRPMFTFRIPNVTPPAPLPTAAAPVAVVPPLPRPRVTVIEPLPPPTPIVVPVPAPIAVESIPPPVVAPRPVLVAPPLPQLVVEPPTRRSPPPVSPVAAPSPRRSPSPPPPPQIIAPAPQPISPIAPPSPRRSPPPLFQITERPSPTRSPIKSPPRTAVAPPRSPVTTLAPRSLTPRSPIPGAAPVPPLSVPNPPLAPPPSLVKDSNFMKPQSSSSPNKSPLPKINSPPPKIPTPPIQKPSQTAIRETFPSPQMVKSVDKTHPPSPLTLPESRLRSNNNGVPEIEQKNVLVQQKIHKPMEILQIHHNGCTSNGNRDHKSKSTHKKPNPEEQGMRVITLAGENKGAVMEFGTNHSKGHTLGNGTKLGKSDGDQSGKSAGEEGMKKKSMEIQTPFTAFLNSNVQGLNNSIMSNCCFRNNDPGIHLSLSRFPNRRRESKE